MVEYKLEEYDCRILREAKEQIMRVYTYHYGAPYSKKVTKRLETILGKLDQLIRAGGGG